MTRALSKTAIGIVCSLAFGVIGIKLLALFTGPLGVGLFSILRQFQQTGSVIASLGGQTALVQVLSSHQSVDRSAYLRAATLSFVSVSSIVAFSVWCFTPWLASWLFNDPAIINLGLDLNTQFNLIRWCILPILLGAAVFFFQGILNGHRALGRLALMQVAGAALGAACAYPSAVMWRANHPSGILLMMFGGLIGSLMVGIYSTWRAKWLHGLWQKKLDTASLQYARQSFLKLAGSTLLGNIFSLVTLLVIRGVTVQRFGLHGAGVFDVAWTISSTYVVLILSSLGAYYLPSLSAETSLETRRNLVARVMRLCATAALPLVSLVILLRQPMVQILYTPDFLEATNIMRWMLIGDFLKICSWVLAMPLLAQARSRQYLMSELIANLSFLGLVLVIPSLQGLGIAFLLSYGLYLTCVSFWAWQSGHLRVRSLRAWAVGAIILLGVSYLAWSTPLTWELVLLCFLVTTAISTLIFRGAL